MPVEAEVEDLQIVVRPKTDQSTWQMIDLSEDFDVKTAVLNAFAHELYSEMIKTKAELEKEAGMLSGLITKIIDNLQVSLKRIHVRVESQDPSDKNNDFSLGISLQSVEVFTVADPVYNNRWFVDRTKKENKNKPMYKYLNITNLGVYYKIRETTFVGELDASEIKDYLKQMCEMDDVNMNSTGRFHKYEDDYLLEPIMLTVNLE